MKVLQMQSGALVPTQTSPFLVPISGSDFSAFQLEKNKGVHPCGFISHRIHGAGIYANMTGVY
jgi:hypothetical protein